ncbi:MAG: lactonase family protein [Bacteroidota bacterium]
MKSFSFIKYLGFWGFVAILLWSCEATPSSTPSNEAMEVSDSTMLVYIGTASGEDSVGIYCLGFDPQSGALTIRHNTPGLRNPGYLALSPDNLQLYAVHGVPGQPEGGVSAFSIDPASGELERINQVSTQGRGACYVSVQPSGNYVMVANYSSGSVATFGVSEEGELSEALSVVQHEGSGPNVERQEGPHAHYIEQGIGGYMFASDLGTDQVMLYELDQTTGALSSASQGFLQLEPGQGPRHVDFHPNGKYVYVMNELMGSVSVFSYDETNDSFNRVQTLSSLPEDFEGFNKSADIHIHPSGKFLYASNRGDLNSIAIFSVDAENGTLALVSIQSEGIAWPRNFAIDPAGNFLLVANRDEDAIRSFRIDLETGMLTDTGYKAEVPKPICIKFTGL